MVLALVYVSLGIILVVFLIQRLIRWRKRSLQYAKLPGPKHQHPLLGDLPTLFGKSKSDGINFHVVFLRSLLGLSNAFRKDGLYRVWLGPDPYVMLFSADTVEPLLSSTTIIQKAHTYDTLKLWLKEGLLTSTAKKWKERRRLLTPTFHYRILDEFVPIIDRHAKLFVEKLSKFSQEDIFDITTLASVLSLEIICETAMGIKPSADQEEFSKYTKAVSVFGEVLMKKLAQPWLQKEFIFSFTSDYPRFKESCKTLLQFSRKVVKERKEELLKSCAKGDPQEILGTAEDEFSRKRKQALLDLLLHLQFKDGSLSDDDIAEEVDTFMFAGHDTTSAGIYWALYHLGRHPEIQENVHQELKEILGDDKDGEITLKDLNKMKYLDRVIKESQRITPSVPLVGRAAQEDINIKGHSIPRGTTLILFIISLHHDPSVFPNPEIFDPDRFLVENTAKRHPFAFVPFSAGMRNCIGQRFAMLEMKVVLSNVIRNFVVESVDSPDRIQSTALMILKPTDGLRIKVKRRE